MLTDESNQQTDTIITVMAAITRIVTQTPHDRSEEGYIHTEDKKEF